MELAVDSLALATDGADTGSVEKTPANKLLFAPPKFTSTPYE